MGQLTVDVLEGLGRAAVRAINWVSFEFEGDVAEAIDKYFRQVAAAGGDAHTDRATPPPGLIVWGGSYSPNDDSWWHFDIWTSTEWESRHKEAVWCLTLGRQHWFFGEIRLLKLLDDYPFTVVVESSRRDRATELASMPEMLKWARGWRKQFPNFRRTAQELDALSRYPVVTIDPNWDDDYIRGSAMAQLVEWFIRVAGSPHNCLPSLATDVYEWWLSWATRVTRRDGRDQPSPGDIFEVAQRSVRPATAAGHRLYWKKSLARPSDDLIVRAAAEAGISRRTAYARLKKRGRQLGEFYENADPFSALVSYLRENSPASRLPQERRTLISLLRESGMKPEAARKLERRIRHLPASEQEVRVRAAIRRASRRS